MKLNAVFGEDLNEIEEQLGSMEENDVYYDMIAPNTQNTELQDEAEARCTRFAPLFDQKV